MTGDLLIDHSAWSRLARPRLSRERVVEISEAISERRLAVCLPFLLEAGYSARGATEHAQLLDRLGALPWWGIDASVERRVIDAQRQLARAGHHRLPPPDIMIAALADCHGLGVLHYDADYDVIVERTDLRFDSVWLAARGSL